MDTGTIVYSQQVRFNYENAAVGTYALMERVDNICAYNENCDSMEGKELVKF